MITGVIKNKIDKIWTDIWAGGMAASAILAEVIVALAILAAVTARSAICAVPMDVQSEQLFAVFLLAAFQIGGKLRIGQFAARDVDVYSTHPQYLHKKGRGIAAPANSL